MEDALGVRLLERARDLDGQPQRVRGRDGAAEWLSFDVLQHQIVGSDVVDLADVRMVQRGNRAGLVLEPIVVLSGQPLHGDDAIEPGVARLPDFAHAPGAEQGEDFVWAEPLAGRQ